MGSLVTHARRELILNGQVAEDPAFAQSLIAAVAAFESYAGYSYASSTVGINMLTELLHFRNLSPLTDDVSEWDTTTNHLWQNNRNTECFSQDYGKTYYSLFDPDTIHETVKRTKQEP